MLFQNEPLGRYSGGMRQRIGIAQALLNNPMLLVVDEPTSGLDPEERIRFRNLICEISGGRIVILSTHIVSDLETIATKVALISRGRLVQHGAPEDLLRSVEGRVWQIVLPSAQVPVFAGRYAISKMAQRSDGVHVRLVSDRSPTPAATAVSPNLEDAYLGLITASSGDSAR